MSKGKFEAGRKPAAPRQSVRPAVASQGTRPAAAQGTRPAGSAQGSRPAAAQGSRPAAAQGSRPVNAQPQGSRRIEPAPRKPVKKRKVWPIVTAAAAVVGVALIIAGILFYSKYRDDGKIFQNIYAGGVNVGGMTKEEAVQALQQVGDKYSQDMVLTLSSDRLKEGQSAEVPADRPITLVIKPEDSKVKVDVEAAVEAAYQHGREGSIFDRAEAREEAETTEYVIEPTDWLSVDESYLRHLAEQTAQDNEIEFAEPTVDYKIEQEIVETDEETPDETSEESEDGEDGEEGEEGETAQPGPKDVQYLYIHTGTTERKLDASAMFDALMAAYSAADFAPRMTFSTRAPSPVDVDRLVEQYCSDPEDARYNETTFEVYPEQVGYGFDVDALKEQLNNAGEGQELKVRIDEIQPEVTKEYLEAALFSDVLASVDTPHTGIAARTKNLMLACDAINGTVLLPGQVFSFNNTVGERTEAKGYQPAIAYVSGGSSKPEIGGGVCQVASSIYYACLLADMEIVERTPHMYAVTYVPMGMDTTIYWGSLDYKFRNNSRFPVRVEASVSGGYVHITLRGTEWKDYTVQMTYEIVATIPWEVKEVEVDDGSYANGQVIDTPYTGYKVITYKHKIDKNGNEISVQQEAVSNYNKRDQTIAVVGRPAQDPTDPTDPTDPPAEQPTDPPAEQPTDPPAEQPTDPPAEQPTDPPPPPPEEVPIPDPPPEEPPVEPPVDG